ncbi:MAG: sulfurtransferase TusA family protein [Campylobacteraceae bacterium]|nr:sulfurtransferase TusA family protein [Campylobacteraceae bacterium]
MISVDAIGLSCPEPVIRIKNAIDTGEKEIEIKVSVGAAVENTQRMAKSQGYALVSKEESNGVVTLRFEKP